MYLKSDISVSLDTTYPREGTETQHRAPDNWQPETQLIPARGRKHVSALSVPQCRPDTTYPREGTETKVPEVEKAATTRHNLSPRGDGNSGLMGELFAESGTQLIPARGRKLRGSRIPQPPILTQLIPARGRKLEFRRQLQWLTRHNLSPRGDGNPGNPGPARQTGLDTTYPREGTETRDGMAEASNCGDTTYPREGTETIFAFSAICPIK